MTHIWYTHACTRVRTYTHTLHYVIIIYVHVATEVRESTAEERKG